SEHVGLRLEKSVEREASSKGPFDARVSGWALADAGAPIPVPPQVRRARTPRPNFSDGCVDFNDRRVPGSTPKARRLNQPARLLEWAFRAGPTRPSKQTSQQWL